MSDYIFLPKIDRDIAAEFDATRLLSNRHRRTAPLIDYAIALYRQPRGSTEWCLLRVARFDRALSLTVSTEEFELEKGDLIVGVPIAESVSPPARCEELPAPLSRRRDNAPVAERVAIRFVHRGARSSYQGDFPYAMATRPSGRLLSIGALAHCQAANLRTLAVMVNIHSGPLTKKEPCIFTMRDCADGKVLAHDVFERNTVAIIEIDPDLVASGECYFECGQALGIPIYVTVPTEPSARGLSVEHTHPPTEYFWLESAGPGVGAIRRAWDAITARAGTGQAAA